MFDYIRVAAAVPTVHVGDTKANLRQILKATDEALAEGARSFLLRGIPALIYSFKMHCKAGSLQH